MAKLCQDTVLNIVIRLPVKSILRFRCVSKLWCKLLKDPDFVKKHLNHAIQMNTFSLMMHPFVDFHKNTYTLAYDHSSSTLSNCVDISYPLGGYFWGTCNGLVCLTTTCENYIVLWNPATKEFKERRVPICSENRFSYTKYGFGYDDTNDDFKVVSFLGIQYKYICEVHVYTLKSNSWSRLETIPYDIYNPDQLDIAQVSVNGVMHWLAKTDSEPRKVIVSLDFKDDRFGKMSPPCFLAEYGFFNLNLCSLGGSLCLHGSRVWYEVIVWEMNSPHGVSCWRTISEGSALVNSNSNLGIHSGGMISFWNDKWVGNTSLAENFKLLSKLDRLQFGSLAEHITQDGAWRFDFKRTLNNLEVAQFAALLCIIGSNPPVTDNLPDTRRWALHTSGCFTVKSLYETFVADEGVDDFPYHFVWKPGVPPKVNFLVGCAVHGKLNSLDMLQHKGMDIYNSCILCGDSQESQDHILLHCKVAHNIWMAATPSKHWSWVFPETLLSFAHSWSFNTTSHSGKVVWDLIPAAVIWVLWRERNCRTFEENYRFKTDDDLATDVKSLVLSWASASGKKLHLNFSNTVSNWETIFS